MKTTPFNCSWDSGQVGWIYVTAKDIRDNWGLKRATKKYKDWAYALLEEEVKMYSQYLEGNVYYFIIYEKEYCESCGHVEEKIIDSCCNFFGYDYKTNGMMESWPEEVLKEIKEEMFIESL